MYVCTQLLCHTHTAMKSGAQFSIKLYRVSPESWLAANRARGEGERGREREERVRVAVEVVVAAPSTMSLTRLTFSSLAQLHDFPHPLPHHQHQHHNQHHHHHQHHTSHHLLFLLIPVPLLTCTYPQLHHPITFVLPFLPRPLLHLTLLMTPNLF